MAKKKEAGKTEKNKGKPLSSLSTPNAAGFGEERKKDKKEKIKEEKKEKIKKEKKKKKSKKKSKSKIDKPKTSKAGVDTGSERREIWKRNFVLGGLAVILVLLNVWLFTYRKETGQSLETEVKQVIEQAREEPQKVEELVAEEPAQSEEWNGVSEVEKDKLRQALVRKETENWKTYKNTVYNFELKYPESWVEPVLEKTTGQKLKYKTKITFRNVGVGPEESWKGFDIFIYRLPGSAKSVSADYSNNLNLKDGVNEEFGRCGEIETASVGSAKYPAMRIYALADDPCYKEAYFYLLQKGVSVFEIVPAPIGGFGYGGYDGAKEIKKSLPEFGNILATWKFMAGTGAARRVVPRITAPKPLAETKIVGGRRVCAKKNDKPRKSKTNKKKHMDMECCLDPDEIPNPWCNY